MATQQQWFAGRPDEYWGTSLQAETEAYAGKLRRAQELTRLAVNSAIRADNNESGAIWLENSAVREAAFGNFVDATAAATQGFEAGSGKSGSNGGKPRWHLPWQTTALMLNLWRGC